MRFGVKIAKSPPIAVHFGGGGPEGVTARRPGGKDRGCPWLVQDRDSGRAAGMGENGVCGGVRMKYVFMFLAGLHLIMAGVALLCKKDKSAKWFFIAACIFALGMVNG